MIFFFDTETTGFVRDRLPPDHEDQPHLVQIAGMLTEDDGTMLSQFSMIVDPVVTIPEQASNIHGITTEKARRCGISEASALRLFRLMANKADLVVAHNIKFDRAVMECVEARAKMEPLAYTGFCTMETAAPIINLPPSDRMIAAGINRPKAPRLEECVRHFFDEALDGAHDALVDVIACSRVYFHLQTLEKAA